MKLNNGKLGELKAKELWTELILAESGGVDDKNGIDGYLNGEKIQIKYDGTISRTGNIYVELYEKSVGNVSQAWRTSKVAADNYIFVTSNAAYFITVNDLAEVIKSLSSSGNLVCRAISETSIGFLIPINKIKNIKREYESK